MTDVNRAYMRAVVFDGYLRVTDNYPVPVVKPGWARIRVMQAGICKTDMELIKGYRDFKGILGHEFVGIVDACDDNAWQEKRVVGEINAACGICDWCRRGLGRHCPHATVLGIFNHDGCMADYCTLPIVNLLEVPPQISDDRAVLTEPLSAACEILEQLPLKGSERVIVLGDGRLGILCAWVLASVVNDITLIGHHREKLNLAKWRHIKTTMDTAEVEHRADVVIDSTGSARGIEEAMRLCRPRGTIVLKTTVAGQSNINLAPIVINEICLLGSRCGQFRDGIGMIMKYPDMPLERLVTDHYILEDALNAFERAEHSDAVKVVLIINQ